MKNEFTRFFYRLYRALLGNEEYEKLAAALQQEPPVSIRINKLRMKEEGLSSLTDSSARFSFNKVPWASDGYYLTSV